MRHEVLWAIRDSRALKAADKAFLYAVETRGTAYGTWETVAADAGMKRDAYYTTRRRLESYGVLSVTERPGRTTVHEVNADWFHHETLPEIPNDPSGLAAQGVTEIRNNPSGFSVMKEEQEGYPVRGTLKKLLRPSDLGPLTAWDRVAIATQTSEEVEVPSFWD